MKNFIKDISIYYGLQIFVLMVVYAAIAWSSWDIDGTSDIRATGWSFFRWLSLNQIIGLMKGASVFTIIFAVLLLLIRFFMKPVVLSLREMLVISSTSTIALVIMPLLGLQREINVNLFVVAHLIGWAFYVSLSFVRKLKGSN